MATKPNHGGALEYHLQQLLFYLGPMTAEQLSFHMGKVSKTCQASPVQAAALAKRRLGATMIDTRWAIAKPAAVIQPKPKRKVDIYILAVLNSHAQ